MEKPNAVALQLMNALLVVRPWYLLASEMIRHLVYLAIKFIALSAMDVATPVTGDISRPRAISELRANGFVIRLPVAGRHQPVPLLRFCEIPIMSAQHPLPRGRVVLLLPE